MIEFLENIGEVDRMNFRQLFLEYIELYVAAESANVFWKLLDITPRYRVVLYCGGEATDEISDRLKTDTAQEGSTRTVHICDKQLSIAGDELDVIDDFDLVVVAIKDFLVEQVILKTHLSLKRLALEGFRIRQI